MKDLLAIVRWIREHTGNWILFASPLIALLIFADWAVENVIDGIYAVEAAVQAVAPYIMDGLEFVAPYYQIANTFFPIAEAFYLLGATAGLGVLTLSIRLVKSLIPGIS